MKSGGIFQFEAETRGAPTASLLLLLLTVQIASLLAPTPSLGGVSKTVSDVCQKSTDAAFRAKYCSAAKDLKQGYNTNVATSAVWSGVSVACGAACGKAVAGNGTYCKIAGYAGAGAEGILAKKFSDSLISEGSKWGSQALAGKTGDATTAGADAAATGTGTGIGAKVNADACQTAGTSALKAYGKFSDSKQNEKGLTQLRDQTKDMNTPFGQNQVAFTGDTQISGDKDGSSESAATAANETCGDTAITTALGAIRCAARADPTLPPYVTSEEFLKDLQKATGKSPDVFFANFESPAKSIFDSPIVNGLSEGQQKGLSDSLSAMEGYSETKAAKMAASSSSSDGYKGRGAARPSSDDDTGFDMNGMIAGVLGQMGGADDVTKNMDSDGNAIAGVDRKPAGNTRAAEDRKISIFDRVQWRYGSVSARDRLGVQ